MTTGSNTMTAVYVKKKVHMIAATQAVGRVHPYKSLEKSDRASALHDAVQ